MNIKLKSKLKSKYEYSIEYPCTEDDSIDYIIYTDENGEIVCIEEKVGGPYGQSHYYTASSSEENHYETIGFVQLQIMGLEILNKGMCWSAYSSLLNEIDLSETDKFRWPAV